MRKTIITLSALCISVFCSAQLKTTSAYDVDGNGAVNISDVSSTVEKVLGRTADSRQVVDAATLNSVLQSIDKSIKDLDARLAAIESKLGSSCNCSSCTGSGEDEKGYYGWLNITDDVTSLPASLFNTPINNSSIKLSGNNLKVGQNFLIATESNSAPTCKQTQGSAVYDFTLSAGKTWDFDSTVTINGKTYYIWFRQVPLSDIVNELSITLN